MRLSQSLHCRSSFWDLTALSPFNDSSIPLNPTVLTSSYAPTIMQKTVPHHPIIDFLPWPSVRDRLIGIFSLPDELRPPCAAGPLALVQLAYDMEDTTEGIRIWGHTPCIGSSEWFLSLILAFDCTVFGQGFSRHGLDRQRKKLVADPICRSVGDRAGIISTMVVCF
jgi:hypothetical protein